MSMGAGLRSQAGHKWSVAARLVVPAAALPAAAWYVASCGAADCDGAHIAAMRSPDATTASSALHALSRDLRSAQDIASFVKEGGLDALADVLVSETHNGPKLDALRLVSELLSRGAAGQMCSSRCLQGLINCVTAALHHGRLK